MTLSSWSTKSLEDVSEAVAVATFTNPVQWFQLYVYKDRNVTMDLVRRAERSGYAALGMQNN
jgi:(S)-2-hydroxy-acid oxidase